MIEQQSHGELTSLIINVGWWTELIQALRQKALELIWLNMASSNSGFAEPEPLTSAIHKSSIINTNSFVPLTYLFRFKIS